MGLFDKMFGRGASEAEQQQGAQQRFNELKQKYQTVLTTADNEHIQFQNLHVQVLELDAFVVSGGENSLIFLFQFVETLLCALLLLGFRRAASKHFVKESHDDFLSLFTINQAGEVLRGKTKVRKNLGRYVCDFCAFLWLLQHLCDEAIDVDARRVEEVNAVMFLRAQE